MGRLFFGAQVLQFLQLLTEVLFMQKLVFAFVSGMLLLVLAGPAQCQVDTKWKIHDMSRPVPAVVDPGTFSSQDMPGRPPSDANVLFDGKDLSKWQHANKSAAKWKVVNGYAEVVAETGNIQTKQEFGDFQLHVEFTEPVPPVGDSQERGNSGVYLQGLYEVQVLDSYNNKTYADGQAAAMYGQYPPQVNASRAPGQWQEYDIVFHAPKFDAANKLLKPARVTVFHNGLLVQDDVELTGPTEHHARPPYKPGVVRGPVALQDHGNPVRFRNIWIREL
jgi:hypothetical protein